MPALTPGHTQVHALLGNRMRCETCGFDNPDSNQFCGGCGKSLNEPAPEEHGPPIPCWKCNELNPDDADLCVHCGADLIETCPQCDTQSRVDTKYCVSCGIAKGQYRESERAAVQSQKYLEDLDYEAAIAEAEKGIKSGYHEVRLKKTLADATALSNELNNLRQHADYLIVNEIYDEAYTTLEEALELAPGDESISNKLRDLKKCINDRDIRVALERAQKAIEDGNRYHEAAAACRKVLGLSPEHAVATKILARTKQLDDDHVLRLKLAKSQLRQGELDKGIAMMRELREEFPWDESLIDPLNAWEQRRRKVDEQFDKARDALGQNNYNLITAACGEIARIIPSHPEIRELKRKAKDIQAEHERRFEEAQVPFEAARYEEALKLFETLKVDFPWDQRIEEAITDGRDLQFQVGRRRAQAQDASRNRQWKTARAAWKKVLVSLPSDEEAKKGLEQARRRLKHSGHGRGLLIPAIAILVIVAFLAGMNHLNIARTRHHIANGNIAKAQSAFDRIGFANFGVMNKNELKRDLDDAIAHNTATTIREAMEAARSGLPGDNPQVMQLLKLDEADEWRARGKRAFDIDFHTAAIEYWTRAQKAYEDAAISAEEVMQARGEAVKAREVATQKQQLSRDFRSAADRSLVWAQTDELMKTASEDFKKGQFESAWEAWTLANRNYEESMRLVDMSAQANTAREAALKAGAEQKAAQLWETAERLHENANKKFRDGLLGEAQLAMDDTIDAYRKARTEAQAVGERNGFE